MSIAFYVTGDNASMGICGSRELAQFVMENDESDEERNFDDDAEVSRKKASPPQNVFYGNIRLIKDEEERRSRSASAGSGERCKA